MKSNVIPKLYNSTKLILAEVLCLTILYRTVTQCLSYPYLQHLPLLLKVIMFTAQEMGLESCYFEN